MSSSHSIRKIPDEILDGIFCKEDLMDSEESNTNAKDCTSTMENQVCFCENQDNSEKSKLEET